MSQKSSILGSGKISHLLFKLAVPAMTAQIINVLYSIVDRIYIGHIEGIGTIALSGIGFATPVIMIISAFSAFVGMGGAPIASIKMGEGDYKQAEKILGNSITVLLMLSTVLTAGFFLLKEPLLIWFGAGPETIEYADGYLSIYLLGTVAVQLALGLNTFISAQGYAMTAMFSVAIGAVLNIGLDPLFIFTFQMGVKGAAWATIISQAASALWILRFLLFSKKNALQVRLHNMRPDWKLIGSVAALGISPFIMQSTESLVQIVLNSQLQKYGDEVYVSALVILMSVMQLFVTPINGFSQGAQPLLSYNYGAGKMDRVKKTFQLLLICMLTLSTIATLCGVFIPGMFAGLFSSDPKLLALAEKAMPIFMGGIFIFGAQLACQTTFLSLGQAKISVFIALLRKVILLVPLAIILPRITGKAMSIYWAEPIADILAATTAVTLFAVMIRKILSRKEKELAQKQKSALQ